MSHPRSNRARAIAASAALVGGVLLVAPVVSAEEITNLAKELSELRSDVEQLSDELATEKTDLQDELRTYARQKAEIQLELDREKMRLQKTRMAIAQKRKQVTEEKEDAQAVVPIFEKTASDLRKYIQSSLPFRIPERLAELEKIENQLRTRMLSPQQALARLWTLIEDEQRMTRDSGVFRQSVAVDGEEQLADVVRLGMVAMYFKTSDDVFGHANKTPSGWGYAVFRSDDDRKLVNELFESFKKQIRVGYFTLPNTLQVEK